MFSSDSSVIPPGKFGSHQAYVLKVISLIASVLSISTVTGVFIYWRVVTRRDENFKFQFRHVLISSLLLFDLIKAVVLSVFPIRYLHRFLDLDVLDQGLFCDLLGFLTHVSIEACDISVLLIAIHTAVSVFWQSKLSTIKWYIWYRRVVVTLLLGFPVLLATLALVIKTDGENGYTYFTSWCYLRVFPVWYRLSLSWGPRFFVMITIAVIYVSIYVNVLVQIRKLETSLTETVQKSSAHSCTHISNPAQAAVRGLRRHRRANSNSTISSIVSRVDTEVAHRRIRLRQWLSQFPGLGFLHPYDWRNATEKLIQTPDGRMATATVNHFFIESADNAHFESSALQVGTFVRSQNYTRFQRRRSIIERQISLLFVYPIVYIFIWLFPLIQEAVHYAEETENDSSYAIALIAGFMKAFSGCLNALVFLFKELKLKHVSTSEHEFRPPTDGDHLYPQMLIHPCSEQQAEIQNQEYGGNIDQQVRSKLWAYKYGRRGTLTNSSNNITSQQGSGRISASRSMPNLQVHHQYRSRTAGTVDVISPLAPVRHMSTANKRRHTNDDEEETTELDMLDFLRGV